MRILFIHSNFPAQFVNLANYYARNPQNEVFFLTAREEGSLPGVKKILYKVAREVQPQTHPYVHSTESAVLQGQAAFRAASQLKQQGLIPDVIYGHSGWGPTLFMKELFPDTPLVCFFEWFYHAHGTDADFDPSQPMTIDDECRIRIKNAPILTDLYSCDHGVSPTHWQHSQFPAEFQGKISVLHDGVNTNFFKPKTDARLKLENPALDLSGENEIITYVARGMEPYRGFPQFMEALAMVQKRRPNCHAVIVGADRVAYGRQRSDGKSYKQHMLETLELDESRIHFTGLLPYTHYLQVLQASSVHVYLTRPFVLSWSMLESMAAGCALVTSATQPVEEVVEDNVNGLLVDFFSPAQVAARIEEVLDDPQRKAAVRNRARETILEKYALDKLLPRQADLLGRIAALRGK